MKPAEPTKPVVTLEEKYKLMIAAFRDLGEIVKILQATVERLEKELADVRDECCGDCLYLHPEKEAK